MKTLVSGMMLVTLLLTGLDKLHKMPPVLGIKYQILRFSVKLQRIFSI